jgi:hypothetical protein
MTLLAIAYVAVSGALLAIAHQPTGPVTTQKTDRLVGESAGSSFLVERFAG